jgi:hypothetical protein
VPRVANPIHLFSEQKKAYLLRYRSLWGALKALQRELGHGVPLTAVMEWRLRQEIDRAYTQCVIDVSINIRFPPSFVPILLLMAFDFVGRRRLSHQRHSVFGMKHIISSQSAGLPFFNTLFAAFPRLGHAILRKPVDIPCGL